MILWKFPEKSHRTGDQFLVMNFLMHSVVVGQVISLMTQFAMWKRKSYHFSDAPKDDRSLADIHLGLYETVIVFDHVEKKAYVILWVRTDRYSSTESAYEDGTKRLNTLVAKLQDDKPPRLAPGAIDLQTRQFGPPLKESTMTPDAYKEAVLQAKEHIKAGDIFQIVLSQRFERRTFADPFEGLFQSNTKI